MICVFPIFSTCLLCSVTEKRMKIRENQCLASTDFGLVTLLILYMCVYVCVCVCVCVCVYIYIIYIYIYTHTYIRKLSF